MARSEYVYFARVVFSSAVAVKRHSEDAFWTHRDGKGSWELLWGCREAPWPRTSGGEGKWVVLVLHCVWRSADAPPPPTLATVILVRVVFFLYFRSSLLYCHHLHHRFPVVIVIYILVFSIPFSSTSSYHICFCFSVLFHFIYCFFLLFDNDDYYNYHYYYYYGDVIRLWSDLSCNEF